MRFLVLGAGAVGGYFGGRLAEAGRDVTFLVRGARAPLLAEHGIRVTSPLGDFRVPVNVATADRVGGPYDVVLLTAKHYDLDTAIAAIRPAMGPDSAVLPLLNGLIHLDRLQLQQPRNIIHRLHAKPAPKLILRHMQDRQDRTLALTLRVPEDNFIHFLKFLVRKFYHISKI